MIFHNDSTGTEMDGLGKVLIERTDLTAVGDSLHYDETDRRVALRKEPRVETLETYLTAEKGSTSSWKRTESMCWSLATGRVRWTRRTPSRAPFPPSSTT